MCFLPGPGKFDLPIFDDGKDQDREDQNGLNLPFFCHASPDELVLWFELINKRPEKVIMAENMSDLMPKNLNACINKAAPKVADYDERQAVPFFDPLESLNNGIGLFTFNHLAIKNQTGAAIDKDKTGLAAFLLC